MLVTRKTNVPCALGARVDGPLRRATVAFSVPRVTVQFTDCCGALLSVKVTVFVPVVLYEVLKLVVSPPLEGEPPGADQPYGLVPPLPLITALVPIATAWLKGEQLSSNGGKTPLVKLAELQIFTPGTSPSSPQTFIV